MALKQLNGGSRPANLGGPAGYLNLYRITRGFVAGIILVILAGVYPLSAQNCDVPFPGSSTLQFSNTCGGATIGDLHLGSGDFLGNGDSFSFDSPSLITIDGNLHIDANGNGRIIIPPGVTVNVLGKVDLHSKDNQCDKNAACTLVFEVYGTLNVSDNLKNDVITLQWEGTGQVETLGRFENSSNGCMTCGNNCPTFLGIDCKDSGKECTIADFCTAVNYGKSTPPGLIINNCPTNIVVSTTANDCQTTVNWVAPTVVDDGTLASFSSTHDPGDLFSLGITTVVYTAVDIFGNTLTCSFNVEVRDLAAPVITQCPSDILVNAFSAGTTGVIVDWQAPIASDNCKVDLNSTHNPGDLFPKGTTTVVYTAVDGAGNVTTCSFNVIIDENNPPLVEPVFLNTQDSQPVMVCFKASDPDGDAVTLTKVDANHPLGTIDNIDSGNLCFTFTPNSGVSGTAHIAVAICDERSACTEISAEIEVINIELVVYQAITPNGDGANDRWKVEGIELFPDNKVTIFDRWGSVVFQARGYNNEDVVWSGNGKSRDSLLPSGTYFYHIQINGAEAKTGFVELINQP